MSSSDDLQDQQLRKHFQDVFADFEQQPNPKAKTSIWPHLPKSVPAYRRYGVLSLCILFLIGTSLYVGSYQPASSNQHGLKASQVAVSRPKQSESTLPIQHRAELSQKQKLIPEQVHPFAEASRSVKPPTHNQEVNLLPTLAGRLDANKPNQMVNGLSGLRLTQPQRVQSKSQSIDYQRISINRAEFRLANISQSVSTDLPLPIKGSIAKQAFPWQTIQSLSLPWRSGLRAQLNRPVRLPISATLSLEHPNTQKLPLRWFAGVSPLSTYQWMTVVAKPETYVQHVDAPAAFSVPTWGYQLSFGVEWRRFCFDLTAGSIRQWAYYTLATNSFAVKPVGVNTYQVTRLDKPVTENIALTIVGAGISKYYRLGNMHSPYFARFGGTVSYVPDTHQSLVWAKGSLGLSLPLTRKYQLQLGPTAEYGVSRLWSTERQLIIHPYLVEATLSIQSKQQ